MVEDQIKGAVRNVAGHVQDAVGGLTGDRSTQAKGMANEAAGGVQYVYGKAVDCAKCARDEATNFVREQPLAGVGIGVLVGLALGYLLADRD